MERHKTDDPGVGTNLYMNEAGQKDYWRNTNVYHFRHKVERAEDFELHFDSGGAFTC